MYVYDGKVIDPNVPQLIGGNQYPAGWFNDAANREAAGIVEGIDNFPSLSVFQDAVRGSLELNEQDVWVQNWTVRNWTADECAAALASSKTKRKDEATSLRFGKETAGIVVNGASVMTDRESQALITGAKSFSDVNPAAMIDWKTVDGWAQIDRTMLISIALAVGAHVQQCFSNERTHHEAIDALTSISDVDSYDITIGWPT